MNCKQVQHIIDQEQAGGNGLDLIHEHLNQCPYCFNYYQLLHVAVNRPEMLWENIDADTESIATLHQMVFSKATSRKSIPLWLSITSAAAAIVFGLLIGSSLYDARQTQESVAVIETNDTLYMAETTEILYLSTLSEEGGLHE